MRHGLRLLRRGLRLLRHGLGLMRRGLGLLRHGLRLLRRGLRLLRRGWRRFGFNGRRRYLLGLVGGGNRRRPGFFGEVVLHVLRVLLCGDAAVLFALSEHILTAGRLVRLRVHLVDVLTQDRNILSQERIEQLFPQAPENKQEDPRKGHRNAERETSSVIMQLDRVFTRREVDAQKGVADGNDVGAFAVDRCRPAVAVGNGGEHDAVVGGGDGSLEESVAVLRELPLILAHRGNGGVERVVVHLCDEDIAAAGGAGVNGDAHLGALGQPSHIDNVRLIGRDIPIGAAHLYADGGGCTAVHVNIALCLLFDGAERGERTAAALIIGVEIGAGHFDVHAVLGFDLGVEHPVDRRAVDGVFDEFVLHLKGILVSFAVVGAPVDDVVVHREATRQSELVFIDKPVAAGAVRHLIHIAELGVVPQIVIEHDVFHIQHRVDERHIAVVDIAVDAIDGKAQLAHKGGGRLGIA